jgi:hypothetical protein
MPAFPLTRPVFGPAIRQIAGLEYFTVPGFAYLFVQVTTTTDHYYQTGLNVRLSIPAEFGPFELDGLFNYLLVTSPTQFVMPFENETGSLIPAPFVIPASPLQAPLVIPIAEYVYLLSQAVHNLLPNG